MSQLINTTPKSNKTCWCKVKHIYHIDFNKDPKFKVGDHVRISKYKNIIAKDYTPVWPEKAFVIKKVKNTVPWTWFISDLNAEEFAGKFYEKEFQKNK